MGFPSVVFLFGIKHEHGYEEVRKSGVSGEDGSIYTRVCSGEVRGLNQEEEALVSSNQSSGSSCRVLDKHHLFKKKNGFSRSFLTSRL